MRRLRHRDFLAISLSLYVLLANCGSTASIQLNDGTGVEGRIVGGDGGERGNVYLADGDRTYAIRRTEIADIDHPGNVAATLGSLLTVYGILNIMVASSQCSEKGAAFCTGVFTPLVLGASLLIYGASVYSRSVSALHKRPTDDLAQRLFLNPTFNVAGRSLDPGLLLGASF
jgi:hypothetical protein